MKFTRREFITGSLVATGLAGAGAYTAWNSTKSIPGSMPGASSAIGHQLRNGIFPQPARTIRKEVVIVGGGIAGLSAAYTLDKAGKNDFMLLELEKQTGGNSCSGKNEVSAYPWGAHYVPLLTQESTVARKLFEDFGIIKGYDKSGLPVYDELFLCADPHERLYMRGRWQDGLVPVTGIGAEVEAEYKRFFGMMGDYRKLIGRDGKKAFAIPIDKSSQDTALLALDQLTMQAWLTQQGFVSAELRWYVNYCCRDDFGTTMAETSAWAGIHYFASRSGQAANAGAADVVTWPEGNGWLADRLAQPVRNNLHTAALVYRVTVQGKGAVVEYMDQKSGESVRLEAKAVIMAVPRFVAVRLLQSPRHAVDASEFSYAPWVVANITLNRLPEGRGVPLSWDNVSYLDNMLGYVNATNQNTQMHQEKTVLTYYWPLSHLPPAAARKEALARSYDEWQQLFLQALLSLHPELENQIRHLDVWVWGHAMVRPTPGFIWGEHRRRALRQHPPIFTAHSDMSGISIFEEACTHGVNAAEALLKWRQA